MKKKLEDYLHLYLGCPMDIGGYLTLERIMGIKQGIGMVDMKMVLRPLSDMTEEEKTALLKINLSIITHRIEFGENYISQNAFGFKGAAEHCAFKSYVFEFNKMDSKEFHFLLSKHFDLFSLIPEGLAIDASKSPVN